MTNQLHDRLRERFITDAINRFEKCLSVPFSAQYPEAEEAFAEQGVAKATVEVLNETMLAMSKAKLHFCQIARATPFPNYIVHLNKRKINGQMQVRVDGMMDVNTFTSSRLDPNEEKLMTLSSYAFESATRTEEWLVEGMDDWVGESDVRQRFADAVKTLMDEMGAFPARNMLFHQMATTLAGALSVGFEKGNSGIRWESVDGDRLLFLCFIKPGEPLTPEVILCRLQINLDALIQFANVGDATGNGTVLPAYRKPVENESE